MILNNINLLTDEQLFRIGLSGDDVEIVKQNSPIESVLNLFGLGISIERIRRLLSLGIIGSVSDIPFVSIEDGDTSENHPCPGGKLVLTDQVGRSTNLDIPFFSGLKDVLFQGFLFFGDITLVGDTVIGPFSDCSSRKQFKISAKGDARVQITTSNPDLTLFPQFKQAAEDGATREAMARFFSDVGELVKKCPCPKNRTPDCSRSKVTVLGPTTVIVNPDDPPTKGGFFKRVAIATGDVEIACLTLV